MSVRGFFSKRTTCQTGGSLLHGKQNLIVCPREVLRQLVVFMYNGLNYSSVVMIKAVIGSVRMLRSVERITAPATFSSS